MYIDSEGVHLYREGSVSILTLLNDTGIPTQRVCLIDVHVLGAQAFNTTGDKEKTTLKDILQHKMIPKVFFDVRNDLDALFAHFGVQLHGVEDVQLMGSATRKTTQSWRLLSGLAKCIEKNAPLSFGGSGSGSWKLAKETGERYELFNQRPILAETDDCCVGDVQCLPELRDTFWGSWASQWRDLVKEASTQCVAASQRLEYQPHSRDKALAPWSNDQNGSLDWWNQVAPPRDNFFHEDSSPYDEVQ